MIGALVATTVLGCAAGVSQQQAQSSQPAPDHDLEYDEIRTYTISKDDQGNYQLAAQVQVTVVPLTKRGTKTVVYSVFEPFYAKVQDLVAKKDGDDLPADQIQRSTVQRKTFLYDDHLHWINFKHVRVGQKLSWTYRQKFSGIRWFPWIPVPNADRLRRFQINIEHPPEIMIDFDIAYHRKTLTPEIARTPRRSTLLLENIAYARPLELFQLDHSHATIWVQPKKGGHPLIPDTPQDFAA